MIETLNQIGEKEILNRLKKFMPTGQIEDDTAQLNCFGKDILVNTDVLVEGVHFSNTTMSAEDIGWKAIATNISDLASSGVDQILGITVGMIAPPSTQWCWVDDVYRGIKKAMKKFGGEIIGGDCSSGEQKVLAITAIGTVGTLQLHRSNALAGDHLVASGPHGLSRLGLALLQADPRSNKNQLPEQLKWKAIKTHQRPTPPIEALRALEKCRPKGLSKRAAGTDSSDGLLNAVHNLCSSSNCQAVLNPQNLPREPNWPLGLHWDQWCMNGGEDFELIVCIPPTWAEAFKQEFPASRTIGLIQAGAPKVIWNNGIEIEESNSLEFKHFS